MLIRAFIALFVLIAPAMAQDSYLIFSTQAAALSRSQQQCAALKCDGVQTIWWWNTVGPLSAGTAGLQVVTANSYALDIQASGPFSATDTNKVGTGTLTSAEISALVTAAQIAPLFPVVVVAP